MAIGFHGQTWVPAADNATTPLGSATPHAVTPPASMTAGMGVIVAVAVRNNTEPAVSNSGGQSWTGHTFNTNGTTIGCKLFSCIYDGTWDANPSFTTGSTADGVCLWMGVFTGVNQSDLFDVDPTVLDLASATAKTLTGFNTGVVDTWAMFVWGEPDDNALSGQDAGWTGPDGSTGALHDHVGNQGGSDIGLFLSKKTQAAAAGTGNNVVALNTADAGAGYYFSIRETKVFALDLATGSGSSYDPTVVASGDISFAPDAATGIGAAYDATIELVAGAQNFAPDVAVGTGQAYDPTIAASGDIPFAPDVATGTGAAHDGVITASGAVEFAPDHAVGTGAAYDGTISASGAAQFGPDAAAGSGSAYDAEATGSGAVSFAPDTASGTGEAYEPAVTATGAASFAPEAAVGSGEAYDATVVGTGEVVFAPDAASGTGVAYEPAIGFVANTTGEGAAVATPGTAYGLGEGLVPLTHPLGTLTSPLFLGSIPISLPFKPAQRTVGYGHGVASRATGGGAGVTKKYMNSAVGGAVAARAGSEGKAALSYEAQNEEELALLV